MPLFRPGKPRLTFSVASASALGAANTLIPFDTLVTEGEWGSTSSGSAAAALEGTYVATLYLNRSAGTGSQIAGVAIRVNGIVQAEARSDSSAAQRGVSCAAVLRLVPGDVVTFTILGAQTGGKNADPGTVAQLVRIGPKRWT